MKTPLSVLLADKGSSVHIISEHDTAFDAAMKMNTLGIGALLVMNQEKLLGIISERDIIRKLISKKADLTTVRVAEIMTKKLVTVLPNTSVQEAMRIITEKRFRHLPVVEHNKLIGLISIGDLTRWVMLAQENEINALTGYIQGRQ